MIDAEAGRLSLPVEGAFTISRGTTETAENVLVRLSDGEHEGVGAAAPSARYGETPEAAMAVLEAFLPAVEDVGDPAALDRIDRRLEGIVRGNGAARAAVGVALHDLLGKRRSLPLYRHWGFDPGAAPPTSYSVAIDDPDRMADRAREAVGAGHSVLKVKLGTGRDRERLRAVREAAPDATVRADANEAWTPREAVERIGMAAEHGVEFVEQPVPADDPEGLRFVHDHAALPLAVDESCRVPADVPRVADRCDVVVVKLAKCGGPRAALRAIHAAHAHGLEVMLGCMLASNAAIAAAWHLAPAVEYADLDGSLLLAEDPYAGVPLEGGVPDLAAVGPGTGARRA